MKQHAFSVIHITVSLLSFSHLLTFSSSSLINYTSIFCREVVEIKIYSKSLIIILKKNNGPKIEPCGILVLISNKSDSEFLNIAWFTFSR